MAKSIRACASYVVSPRADFVSAFPYRTGYARLALARIIHRIGGRPMLASEPTE